MTNEPVYKAVANTLAKDIASGKYDVGSVLPTERELCEIYQISRHTARESLRQLEQRGLISKRQGSGSTVLAQQPALRYEQGVQSIDDLLHQGNQSRMQVLDTRQVDDAQDRYSEAVLNHGAKQAPNQAESICIKIDALRYALNDTRPLAIVSVYVAAQNSRHKRKLLEHKSAVREIVATVDINRIGKIEQGLSAVKLDRQQATILQVKSGDAAMRTLRHYFDPAGKLLVIANSLYQGEMYTYLSTLRRSQ